MRCCVDVAVMAPVLYLHLPLSCLHMVCELAPENSHHVTLLQIKLGASLFIPNSQIGTFGAVTQFKSLVRNNTDMFDVSFAGPLAAATTSLLLFAVGLAWSSGADIPKVRHTVMLASTWCLSSCLTVFCQW